MKEREKLMAAVEKWAAKQAKFFKKNPGCLDDDYDRESWVEGFLEGLDHDIYEPLGQLLCYAFEQQCARIGVELKREKVG